MDTSMADWKDEWTAALWVDAMASSKAGSWAVLMVVMTAALMVCSLVVPTVDSREEQMVDKKAALTAAKRVAPMAKLMAGSKAGSLVLHWVAMLGASMAVQWAQLMVVLTAGTMATVKGSLMAALKESRMAEQTVGSRGKQRAEL